MISLPSSSRYLTMTLCISETTSVLQYDSASTAIMDECAGTENELPETILRVSKPADSSLATITHLSVEVAGSVIHLLLSELLCITAILFH